MKKIILTTLMSFIGIMMLSDCVFAIRYDGPYEGRVIDADTGEPIDGVVVLGEWSTVTITPGGGVYDYYDAKETLTDKNGEFSIPGTGLRVMSNIAPMNVLIFKAGYEHIGLGPWSGLKEGFLLSKKIKWEGAKAIIPLKKMTMEERKERLIGKESIPDHKQKLLIKELNREKRELGKSLYPEVE
jgi:hypothetical protein